MSPAGDIDSQREHLLERLQNLRAILPVFATELASARRQATRLRLENDSLRAQVRQLQFQRSGRDRSGRDDTRARALVAAKMARS